MRCADFTRIAASNTAKVMTSQIRSHIEYLIQTYLLELHGVHTFISYDGQRRSWIDHVVCSRPLMSYFGVLRF